MLETLYIVRHGEAMPHGTPGISDDDRPLTPEGEKRFRVVARGFARLEPRLDRVVTSPLPRARRTAELLVEALRWPRDRLEVDPSLSAHEDSGAIARWVHDQCASATGSMAIVGHNPWCEELLGRLVAGAADVVFAEFRKGAIAALHPGVRPSDRWGLEWLAQPRLLRRLGKGAED
jgi:phosphohistidine phosphatase